VCGNDFLPEEREDEAAAGERHVERHVERPPSRR
jgi:hypothetical protein